MNKTFTVHDLPSNERPRERLNLYGAESLSLPELFALILGKGIKGESILVTSQKILSQFKDLSTMSHASLQDFQSIKGIGFAKASQLLACFEIARRLHNSIDVKNIRHDNEVLPRTIYQQVKTRIGSNNKEHFLLVSLDVRIKIIAIDLISIGTLNASLVHPREVFQTALRRHAASVIFVHNHPSNDTTPSDEDINLTERLINVGLLMGIPVFDHLIISLNDYYSFKENNILNL